MISEVLIYNFFYILRAVLDDFDIEISWKVEKMGNFFNWSQVAGHAALFPILYTQRLHLLWHNK